MDTENRPIKIAMFSSKKNDIKYFDLTNNNRPYNIFILVTKGGISFTNNSEEIVANKNEIIFIPADTPFTTQVSSQTTFHLLAFNVSEDYSYFKQINVGKLFIPKGHVKCIAETLSTVNETGNGTKDLYLHTIKSIMVENYVYKKSISSLKNAYPKDISSVIEHMSFNLNQSLNISDMAKMINLSHVGLIWKFRKFVGSTPSQYLIAMRMREAKNLLLDSNLAIKEIAVRCGYDNPYYFSNAFNDFFGQRPKNFRKVLI